MGERDVVGSSAYYALRRGMPMLICDAGSQVNTSSSATALAA